MRLSKKWLNATFSSFFHPVLALMARSAPNAKYENLWVFIRSDAHVVRAGLNIRGCGPLSTLGFFDKLRAACLLRRPCEYVYGVLSERPGRKLCIKPMVFCVLLSPPL